MLELLEPLVEALRWHRALWRDEKPALGPRSLNEWDLVFTADLPRIRFHDLRHANASLMHSAHVLMEMLSKLLGHSNPTTTRNIYAHVLKPPVDEAKQARAGILTSGGYG